MEVTGASISSNLARMNNGIGVGTTKESIIEKYIDHSIYIIPEYSDEGVPSKTRSILTVRDNVMERGLVFTLVNKKVVSIRLISHLSDSE
jgi:hypothetical protein